MTRRHRSIRRGFTIVELILAGVIAAMVLGALTISMSQIVQAKSISRERLDAFVRADVALRNLRRDIVSTLRRDDLFYTRFVIEDNSINTPLGQMERDSLLVFNHRLRASREIDYNGEGVEYETAYRIDEDEWGPVLWQRRDALPDQYPTAGGVVTPIAEGVVALALEAFDGEQWLDDWDSDYDGIPHAVRVTVQASGHLTNEPALDAPIATLRTIVPIERAPIPDDVLEDRLQTLIAELNGETTGDGPLSLQAGGGQNEEGESDSEDASGAAGGGGDGRGGATIGNEQE
jgi:general secretion pathway protein J